MRVSRNLGTIFLDSHGHVCVPREEGVGEGVDAGAGGAEGPVRRQEVGIHVQILNIGQRVICWAFYRWI